MSIEKLAQWIELKYKLAGKPEDLEHSLRKKIDILWNYPNKLFNILRICADVKVTSPKDKKEEEAISGHKFCQKLLSMIDYLKIHRNDISLGELREVIVTIIKLIEENKDLSDSPIKVQFPQVSELIFQIFPIEKKYDMKLRNDQYGKARTGLSRIFNLALEMMEDISKLEIMIPEKFIYQNKTLVETDINLPEKLQPQRSPISEYDIKDFIRQHGDEYGLTMENWDKVVFHDPELKEKLTTLINALNRGYKYKSLDLKEEINQVLKNLK